MTPRNRVNHSASTARHLLQTIGANRGTCMATKRTAAKKAATKKIKAKKTATKKAAAKKKVAKKTAKKQAARQKAARRKGGGTRIATKKHATAITEAKNEGVKTDGGKQGRS